MQYHLTSISDTTIAQITEAIQRSLTFLAASQSPSGEFPTYWSKSPSMSVPPPTYIESPFTLGHILLALSSIEGEEARSIRKKSISYLMAKQRDNGYFSFFNEGDCDLDDTCLLNWVLQSMGTDRPFYRMLAERIARLPRKDGLYETWIRDDSNTENDVDPCVNVNVGRFLDYNGINCNQSIRKLRKICGHGDYIGGTIYYNSGFALPYYIYTLPQKLRNRILGHEIPSELRGIRLPRYSPDRRPSIIDDAMKLFIISLNGGNIMKLKLLASCILAQECQNGGWPIWAVYWQSNASYTSYWGSTELTTAIVTQALYQYRNLLINEQFPSGDS